MSTPAGLAFEQAPPFSLPLRFFLAAPLFLILAAVLIGVAPDALASRWTPEALALTHTVVLGTLAMTMLGALMQMLPVVAGTPLPWARGVALFCHIALALGTLAMATAFLTGAAAAYGLGIALLGSGFGGFLVAAAISLARAARGVTVAGIRTATLCLAATVALGIALALWRGGWWQPPDVEAMIAAHVALGLLGWVLLLVIGVAYQVVPMFQITPPYPPLLSRWLIPGLFALLVARALSPLLSAAAGQAIDAALAIATLLFAITTLRLQARRRRRLPDVTLDFWRLGMGSLIACVVVWLAARLSPAWAASDVYPLLIGVLFIGGFALSVVNGMLYKIVPFLAWFHLQAQLQARAGSIPTMKQMISEPRMRWQFRLHLAACLLLAAAPLWPHSNLAASPVLALSAALLWVNLLAAVRRYRRHGGRLA